MQTGRPVRPVQCVPDAAGPRHRPDAVLHRAQEGASRLRPSYALSLDVGQSFLLSPARPHGEQGLLLRPVPGRGGVALHV